MNKFTKRILLCNDVILGIRFGRVSPVTSSFMSSGLRNEFRNAQMVGTQPVVWDSQESCQIMQDKVQTLQNCEVCANGALFLAFIGRFDGVSYAALNHTTHNNFRDTKAAEVFGKRLVDEIECVYEGRNFSWQVPFSQAHCVQFTNFRNKVLGRKSDVITRQLNSETMTQEEKKKLLTAIMQRIIDNDGRKLIA